MFLADVLVVNKFFQKFVNYKDITATPEAFDCEKMEVGCGIRGLWDTPDKTVCCGGNRRIKTHALMGI